MSIDLDNIASGYNLSQINGNFQKVEDYINTKLLARAPTGVAGEAMMTRDLDMNGNTILNADIDGSSITNDRALRVPVGEGDIPPLDIAANRKGKVLTFDINTGLPITTAPASGSAVDVLNQLALPTGASLIGTQYASNLALYLAQLNALFSVGIHPELPPYNYNASDDIATRTASLLSAHNAAQASKSPVIYSRFYDVNPIVLDGHSDYKIMGGGGLIVRGTDIAAVTMKNCRNIVWDTGLSINKAGTFSYGLKVYGDSSTGTSLNTFGLTMTNFPIAFRFGDETYPDALCSEMVVHSGYTFNCRRVVELYGSQTVVEFNHYQMLGNGDDSVGNNTKGIATLYGGILHINGGEVIQTTDSLSQAFQSFPINSPLYEHAYGGVYINGSAIECAGLWFIAYNPNSVSSPSDGSGSFVLNSCHGYAGFTGVNVQVADNFTGKIIIDSSNKFHRLGAKTSAMVIASNNAYPICDLSDSAFDSNFPKGFQKYNGSCVPLFSYRRIGQATNLAGQTISGGGNQTDLRFQSVDTSALGDNGMFIDNYVPSSGFFTVPKGGLKNACLYVQWDVGSSHANSTLYAMANVTTPLAMINGDSRLINGYVQLGNLVEGTLISLRYQNGGSTFTALTQNSDYFAIFGSRG